ncbi:MAG TPA: hypothetical protein VMW36_00750 [Patescibacteria group bacterium]|nr:hypothetical protein [Patescibacteria group bacterium]
MVKALKGQPWRKKAKEVEKDLKKKIGLFDRMGDHCLVCEDFFDKTDVEMVTSWHVVVRKVEVVAIEQDVVRLYCPTCWSSATKVISDFKEHIDDTK